jgi:hypothetical protein
MAESESIILFQVCAPPLCASTAQGVPPALLAPQQMKVMIGERFHASGWRGQDRFSNTLAFCLKKPAIVETDPSRFP